MSDMVVAGAPQVTMPPDPIETVSADRQAVQLVSVRVPVTVIAASTGVAFVTTTDLPDGIVAESPVTGTPV